MTQEQIEAIIWLLLEHKAHLNKLNIDGMALLLDMRSDWNLERAEKVLL